MDMELGFLGFGSMGQAIARGLLDAGVLQPGQIHACAAHYDSIKESAPQLISGLRCAFYDYAVRQEEFTPRRP